MASHKPILVYNPFPQSSASLAFSHSSGLRWNFTNSEELALTIYISYPRLPWTSFCLLFSLAQIIAHDNLFLAFLSLLEHKPFESLNWVWLQCLEKCLAKKKLSDVHVIVTACDARSGHLNTSHTDARQDLRVQEITKKHQDHWVQAQVRRENSGK